MQCTPQLLSEIKDTVNIFSQVAAESRFLINGNVQPLRSSLVRAPVSNESGRANKHLPTPPPAARRQLCLRVRNRLINGASQDE